jgi:biotin transport system substrate-specific component
MKQLLLDFRVNMADAAERTMRPVGIVLGGTILAAVCAHVSIPLLFTPVPLSLQPFAVLLLGLLLTPGMAAGTFAVYLAEGAAGLPVFAPAAGATVGMAHLLGPTGGYLMAYPAAAALISWLWRRTGRNSTGRSFGTALMSAAAGALAILACGSLWFAALPHVGAQTAIIAAMLPFLPGDALKVAAAAGLAAGWVRLHRRGVDAHPR